MITVISEENLNWVSKRITKKGNTIKCAPLFIQLEEVFDVNPHAFAFGCNLISHFTSRIFYNADNFVSYKVSVYKSS